jgi:hypothetical protein
MNPFFPDPLDVMRARIAAQLEEASREDGPTRIARENYEQRKSPTAPAWDDLSCFMRAVLVEHWNTRPAPDSALADLHRTMGTFALSVATGINPSYGSLGLSTKEFAEGASRLGRVLRNPFLS